MDWNPIGGGQMPDEGVEVLLHSKKAQYYIGTYHPNAGIFRVISQYKLQEDGSILGLTTGFHESNFTHWAEITLPISVTTETAKEKKNRNIISV